MSTRRGRPAPSPKTALGVAVRERRGDTSVHAAGRELGVAGTTLAGIERGAHRPTYDTAVKLAAWLGWTTDQVMDAARKLV